MKKIGKKKYCIGLLSVLLSVILTLNSCQSKKEQEKEVEKKYNVLFISIDDLRTELNCYGSGHIKSPNIDRLASQEIRFSNAHVK